MWHYWWIEKDLEDRPLGGTWPYAALLGLSLILLGVLIVIEPALLALLVASGLVATGLLVLVPALLIGWTRWRHRPRRIHVRRTW